MKQLDYRQSAEEKYAIALDVFPILYKRFNNLCERFERAAKKSKTYPYYAEMETTVAGSGKWIVFAVFVNKLTASRGMYFQFHAFQTYEMRHARNPMNNGLGLFYMTALGVELDVQISEFPPHLINRMIERLPDVPLFSMNVSRLCGFILKENLQGSLTITRDNKTMKCGDKDVPTTVISTRYGQFLGILPMENYICNLTFISNREMRLSQYAVNNFNRILGERVCDHKVMENGFVNPEIIEEVFSELNCDDMIEKAYGLLADDTREYEIASRMTGK